MKARRPVARPVWFALLILLPFVSVCAFAQGGPPQILTQPQSQTIYLSNSATFYVEVSSVTAANYQWRFNGTNISGATATNYTIASAVYSNAGDYSVVVSNAVGWTYSSNATLTVYGPPLIT